MGVTRQPDELAIPDHHELAIQTLAIQTGVPRLRALTTSLHDLARTAFENRTTAQAP